MAINLDECYDVVFELVKKGGKIIRERISSKKTVQTKSSAIDFVTETDQEVEKLLISHLHSRFPEHRFIGEESTAEGAKCELTDSPTWIIDPVDGTMNFVHSYPNVCTSVALLVNKIPEIAIIYNPVLELMFTARKGQGAQLNGKPIHASGQKEMTATLLLIEPGTSRDPKKVENVFENLHKLVPLVHGTRSCGSAALNMAMIASGWADLYFEFGIHAWDMAAGDLLVREAGGVCIDPAGGKFDVMSRRVLCAATEELARDAATKIVQLYPPRD